jgi:hypothetical protein
MGIWLCDGLDDLYWNCCHHFYKIKENEVAVIKNINLKGRKCLTQTQKLT